MLCGRRWYYKVLAIALISMGLGLFLGTILSWGWFMILLSGGCVICGIMLLVSEC